MAEQIILQFTVNFTIAIPEITPKYVTPGVVCTVTTTRLLLASVILRDFRVTSVLP